jgi:hypothetical protein
MSNTRLSSIRLHEDTILFREAVEFTAAETGFAAGLVEKDYFCTVLLAYLASVDGPHVFKGGTCLAKVYAGFYRLSEDIDYTVPTRVDAPRSQRSRQAAAMKAVIGRIPAKCPCFRVVDPLCGANNSTQYVGTVSYTSFLNTRDERIKIEIGLRESLLTPVCDGLATTLLIDPASRTPAVPPIPVRCISDKEAFAEKFRAALTRREVAIRDFYDIDYAVRRLGLAPAELVGMIQQKLAVPGKDSINVRPERLGELRLQLMGILRPVLRQQDFEQFDLNRAFKLVSDMADVVS